MRSQTLQSVILPFLVVASAAANAAAQGWTLRNTLTAPAARNSHAMCYDVTRGVAVVFGGQDASLAARADTWEWNSFGWVQRNAGPAPQARWGHGMAFDIRRARTVLFGGLNAGGALGDCWEWDGTTWLQCTASAMPAARGLHGMAYDSVRRVTVLFGGEDAAGASLADTWTFDGQNWAQSSASGPAARRGAAVTFDDTRRELLVFGGADGAQVFGDTWAFDGTAWAQRATTGPSARWRAALQHDTLCGIATLHGGTDATLATAVGDTWTWDGVAWTQAAGANASARHGAAIAFDAQRGQNVLFGGRGASAELADTWLRNSPCSRTMTVVTPPQVGNTAVFRFDYPPSAAGHFYYHQLTAHEPSFYPVPIPGFTSLGVSRVDLFNPYLQPTGWLDGAGTQLLNIGIPPDNFLAGLPFDMQSVDIDVYHKSVFWGANDAEVSIAGVDPPVADFALVGAGGIAPLAVGFRDLSTGSPMQWQWDFNNDGTVDSTIQNPPHVYSAPGRYSVRLVVSNFGGSGSMLRLNAVNVGPRMPLVPVSPGSFQMGSAIVGGLAEPVHAVTITRPFWLGQYEVTQAEFESVMGYNPSSYQGPLYPNNLQRPVERVSWQNAMNYCGMLNIAEAAAGRIPQGYQIRLPTEAEWEYACRAGTTSEWSTGLSIDFTQANIENVVGQTSAVGVYAPNGWGLHDMHGNAWEWCLDGVTSYASSPSIDPYVSSGAQKAYRGGSWFWPSAVCRSAHRQSAPPDSTADMFGLRVCLGPSLVAPTAAFEVGVVRGTVPLTVSFKDNSGFAPEGWAWDFNDDGIVDSNAQNPTYTYATPGLYSVRLVSSNSAGSATVLRPNLIHAGPAVGTPLADMVAIPPGTFIMGSAAVGTTAYPPHVVTITRPFWIGKYEVSQRLYQQTMGGLNPSTHQGAGNALLPVDNVTWSNANAFCEALTIAEATAGRMPGGYVYRLPTEAEWEYCCRAGTTSEWNVGTSLSSQSANFNLSRGQTSQGGAYAPNAFGLSDTHGNVWEWCLDSWDNTANYPGTPVSDPIGVSGSDRVLRGGSWRSTADNCRSARRGSGTTINGQGQGNIGFRIVLAPVIE